MTFRSLLIGCLSGCVLAPSALAGYCVDDFESLDPDVKFYFSVFGLIDKTSIVDVFTGGLTMPYVDKPGYPGFVNVYVNGVYQTYETDATADMELNTLCTMSFPSSLRKENSGAAVPVQRPPAGQTSGRVVVADFNGDGVLDSASLTSSRIVVTLYNPDQTTLSLATYPVAGIADSIVAADFNGDGHVDLAVTQHDPGQGNVVVLLGKGDGTFGPPTKLPAAPAGDYYFSYLASGDFNGDGTADRRHELAVNANGRRLRRRAAR